MNPVNNTTSAEDIAKALGGRKCGTGWIARCPAHDDHDPSLSISESFGKMLWKCHAGCSQEIVFNALRERGLLDQKGRIVTRAVQKPSKEKEEADKKARNIEQILTLCTPAKGTIVETYLRSRGIASPPSKLLFHRSLRHETDQYFPTMIARPLHPVTGDPIGGIHRTFLAADGAGKAQVDKAKMMLGPYMGGVVTFGHPADDQPLLVGEGIETTLSGVEATGFPGMATLSANNLETLTLPAWLRDVIILADRDPSGRGQKAAEKAASRWSKEGRKVRIAIPKGYGDFNDLLCGGAK